jgi:hypothetical protein
MKVTGIVHILSVKGVRAAALTDYGYTVFDIHDGEVAVQDEVTGSLDDHGDAVLANATTGQTVTVYIEAIHATRESALLLCDRRR